MYFELISPNSDSSSVHLTLKMHLMTFLLLEFHSHDHLILGAMMLLRSFI